MGQMAPLVELYNEDHLLSNEHPTTENIPLENVIFCKCNVPQMLLASQM